MVMRISLTPFRSHGQMYGYSGVFCQHQATVWMSAIAVKPAQQPKHDTVGVEGVHAHWLVVILHQVRVLRVRGQNDVRFPMQQVLGSKARDLSRGDPMRHGVLRYPDPFLVLGVPKIERETSRAEGPACLDQLARPIGIVQKVRDLSSEVSFPVIRERITPGGVFNVPS